MNAWGRMFKKKTQNVFNDETDSSSIEYDLSPSLEDNLGKVKEAMGHSGDLIVREFEMGKPLIQKVATIYLNGLTDKDLMGNLVIEKLMADIKVDDNKEGEWPPDLIGAYVKDHLLTVTHVEVAIDLKKLLSLLLTGQTIVLIDRWNKAFACASQGGEIRSIQEPTTENSVRGPKESFTESLITNTSLIRRRIKSPNVWLETRKLGKITQTDIGVMYINGIANEKLINEVRER
ncbi:spore germination protein, partial [Metabacillus halosaccharovorans]